MAHSLRQNITPGGLRALAAQALHAAAAAPERLAETYDNAAAGWLSHPSPEPQPQPQADEPLPVPPRFWSVFWDLVALRRSESSRAFAIRALELAAEMDLGINPRMAAVASHCPGVVEAASHGIPEPLDLEALAACRPGSLGFLLSREIAQGGGHRGISGPGVVALLQHMPSPLNYINVQVVRALPLLALVAGYGRTAAERAGLRGFLMGQVAHHHSALMTAVTLTVMSNRLPADCGTMLDSIFRGWTHGRETPPLIGAHWPELCDLSLDQVRNRLGVTPFGGPATSQLNVVQS